MLILYNFADGETIIFEIKKVMDILIRKFNTSISCFLLVILSCFLNLPSSLYAQINLSDYQGGWETTLKNSNTFNIDVSILPLKNGQYEISLFSDIEIFKGTFDSSETEYIQFKFYKGYTFKGMLYPEENLISGFIQTPFNLYHIKFEQKDSEAYQGKWNLFFVDQLEFPTLYLSVEDVEGENYSAYPIFADQRFRGTWATDFRKEKEQLLFRDAITGLEFTGRLKEQSIEMDIALLGTTIATTTFKENNEEWDLGSTAKANRTYEVPQQFEDDQRTSSFKTLHLGTDIMEEMVDSINENALTHVHSVLFSIKGDLVCEHYFSGYTKDVPHDQRSASKSISSAMIGIAIEDGLMEHAEQALFDFIPESFQQDSLKAAIRLKDLLTMSSGIDAIDFGIERKSAASEDVYQNSQNWLKTVLDAPMIDLPGAKAYYGSANPYLLGVALNEALKNADTPQLPLELYMDAKLFHLLGIHNYIINTDPNGLPYFGGGTHLRPRDMLRFGALYLNNGTWNGQEILSKKWVQESHQKYLVLENANEKNEYGYLWWHKSYNLDGRIIKSIEARGAGGQYIFVVPELELVAAITSGNYRNGRFWQPELIFEKYILPTVLHK